VTGLDWHRLFVGTGLPKPVGIHPELYVLYALGIAAAALLWVPKDWRHRAIAGLLMAVWLWVALGELVTFPGFADWERAFLPGICCLLAILEACLLFLVGVFPGSLSFEGRRGPWPVLGGILLVYALAVHPLLGAVVPGVLFGAFSLGLPFPPLAFTLGLLLFLKKPCPPWVLAVPLLWSAVGGSCLGSVHLWVLRISFIVGCAFVVLPEEIWKSRWRIDGRFFCEESLRRRNLLAGLLGSALAGALIYLLLWENGVLWGNGVRLGGGLERLAVSLGLLAACALVWWLAFPAWLSPGFRDLAWTLSKGVRALWVTFGKAWKWGLLLGMAVAFLQEVYSGKPINSPAGQVLVLGVALLWFLQLAYAGRNRLMIKPFEDFTGAGPAAAEAKGKDGPKVYTGLDADLRDELARISDLFRVIDEALPEAKPGPIDVTPNVNDVGEILKGAAAGTTKFLGFNIPTDVLFSLIGLLVRGPRITGSIHGSGNGVYLIADLSGGGKRGNWRVDCTDLEKKEDQGLSGEPAVRKLTEQLAYRVATTMVSVGSPRWQAVRSFVEGLRAYRETQRIKQDSEVNLRKAETCLLAACKDDVEFAQCHYNLGLVYKKLGKLGSAKPAYRAAIKMNPAYYQACFALAEVHVDDKEYAEALWVCDSAIGIAPQEASAWDLKAYALRKDKEEKDEKAEKSKESEKPKEALTCDGPVWDKIREFRQIAAALSWRSLCRGAIFGTAAELERRQREALLCTSNLAVILGYCGQDPESERVFRQPVGLGEHDPHILVSFGKTLYWSGQWKTAAAILDDVYEDSLEIQDRASLWAILALARQQIGLKESAQQAAMRLFDLPASRREGEDLASLIKTLEGILDRASKGESRQDQVTWVDLWNKIGVADLSKNTFEAWRDAYRAADPEGKDTDGVGARWLRLTLLQCRFLQTLEPEKTSKERKTLDSLKRGLQPDAPTDTSKNSAIDEWLAECSKCLRKESEGSRNPPDFWEWAYCQVKIRQARCCLELEPSQGLCVDVAQRAKSNLEEAIQRLEKMVSSQVRHQGLYGLLAQAEVIIANSPAGSGEANPDLQAALAYSERAADLEPEGARERLALVRSYSALGDYDQAMIQAKIALDFDAGLEGLKVVGDSFWKRADSAGTRQARRTVLSEAKDFFSDALCRIESRAFDTDQAREQIERHAWAHHWLGRCNCELTQYEVGIGQLEVAKSMGFKPVESRVILAWAHLESRSYEKAEAALLDALAEGRRRLKEAPERGIAQAMGEERPIAELRLEALLGFVLLQSELELEPKAFEQLVSETSLILPLIVQVGGRRQSAYLAEFLEVRAWILLRAGKLEECLKEARASLRLGFRSGAYVCVAYAHLDKAKSDTSAREAAREAWRRAGATDLRDRYQREICEIDERLKQLDSGGATPPTPAKGPSPAGPPRPAG
jgi:tetratricopeptide (TPR) repeat protein